MADLSAAAGNVHARLEAKHEARERALRESRRAIRSSANAIRAAHRREQDTAEQLLGEARAALDAAHEACRDHLDVEHAGFLHDAQKEYAEGRTTLALVTGDPLPGPDAVGVPDTAWLNGLAETVGELRRHLLDELRGGGLERCEELLDVMDGIYALLVTIDFPEGVTAGLRRSTDVARSIIERTRGDFTTAVLQARLQASLDAHRRDVLGP